MYGKQDSPLKTWWREVLSRLGYAIGALAVAFFLVIIFVPVNTKSGFSPDLQINLFALSAALVVVCAASIDRCAHLRVIKASLRRGSIRLAGALAGVGQWNARTMVNLTHAATASTFPSLLFVTLLYLFDAIFFFLGLTERNAAEDTSRIYVILSKSINRHARACN
jgi:hypothetical protein